LNLKKLKKLKKSWSKKRI